MIQLKKGTIFFTSTSYKKCVIMNMYVEFIAGDWVSMLDIAIENQTRKMKLDDFLDAIKVSVDTGQI